LSQPATIPPQSDRLRRHLLVAFVLALAFYVAVFSWIEHLRVVKGPWEIAFFSDASGRPSLQISQPRLGISEKLIFPDDQVERPNLSEWIKFSGPATNLPFGEILMQDALYLPGSVTMRLFGRQIEVLPRTLIIDKNERAWQTGAEIVLRRPKK
jgi:hypothetical protein